MLPEPASHLSLATVDGASVAASDRPDAEVLREQMDALSLEQALIDAEVANARVVDLTARLVESNRRVTELTAQISELRSDAVRIQAEAGAEVDAVHAEMAAHDAYLNEQRSSQAYRWAAKVWNLRNALRT
jgi:predicted  nucleic acid-binding Zn-ribbon protein